jgi:dTDP-4-dehydrorhamnose reductase
LLIAITGPTGLLGREVVRVFKKEYDVIELPHNRLDISNLVQVQEVMLGNHPAVFINCAAYTAVDKAEEEKGRANLVNGLGVRNLALVCKELDIPLVHISTDYVFDGQKDKPWCIFDGRNPINAYGYSKYLGERYLESINPKYYLIRTSWLFGSGGVNFANTILRAALKQPKLRVVNDQFGCPTYAVDLAEAILELVKTGIFGVYHITNRGVTSWYEYAKFIVKEAGVGVPVVPVSSAEFLRPAKRPKNSALDPFPLQETIGRLLPPWQDAVRSYLREVKLQGSV